MQKRQRFTVAVLAIIIVSLCVLLSTQLKAFGVDAKAAGTPVMMPSACSWNYERAYIDGQQYLVFTTYQGGIFVMRK